MPKTALTPEMRIKTDPDLWREFGETFEWTRNAILRDIGEDTPEYQATLEVVAKLRTQLLAQGDSDLERLAIEEVITCHLQNAKAGFRLENIQPNEANINEAKFWSKVNDRAQFRLLRSLQMLTRLRKANLDIKMKLWRNRPIGYKSLDYLEREEADSNDGPT